MAQSVIQNNNLTERHYSSMTSPGVEEKLLKDLRAYIQTATAYDDKQFYSFAAVFDRERTSSEEDFEQKLWGFLHRLHQHDPEDWDPSVSSDPENDNFSFSLLGHAFYIIGMHPNSSRKARSIPKVTVIFNLHNQFEILREMGVYTRVRDKIRKRDLEHQGSINPMLKDFGKESEARQYSGRKVEKDWKCPFAFLASKLKRA